MTNKIIPYEKSFASHEKAQYWSDKNELKPNEVFKSSGKKYIFDCNKCNHELTMSLNDITNGGNWCAYCASNKLCDDNNCIYCFNKSFASHDKATYWSNKNKMKPRDVCKKSSNKYIFVCDLCKHKFDSTLSEICRGSWCPYCCNPPKKLCENKDCILCFNKSFASNEKSKYWSNKNELLPEQVFKNSNKKYWFKCKKNHDFPCPLNDIYRNRWCPYCVNKTEQKLYDALILHYPNLKPQFKVDWCMIVKHLPYDFVLDDDKIIIELDGPQHFEQVSNWQAPEETHLNDVYKMKCANDNGYSVIRLLQTNVFYDTYDWLTELRETIEKFRLEQRVQNVYMCKDNEYDEFTL